MDLQYIIVAAIILTALIYVGLIFLKKLKSLNPKNSPCANDCGCSTKAKGKI